MNARIEFLGHTYVQTYHLSSTTTSLHPHVPVHAGSIIGTHVSSPLHHHFSTRLHLSTTTTTSLHAYTSPPPPLLYTPTCERMNRIFRTHVCSNLPPLLHHHFSTRPRTCVGTHVSSTYHLSTTTTSLHPHVPVHAGSIIGTHVSFILPPLHHHFSTRLHLSSTTTSLHAYTSPPPPLLYTLTPLHHHHFSTRPPVHARRIIRKHIHSNLPPLVHPLATPTYKQEENKRP